MLCDKLVGTLGCMRREPAENLIPLDLEIERTLKRILRDKREAARMEQLPMGLMEENRDNDVGLTMGVVYILMRKIWIICCHLSRIMVACLQLLHL